MRRLNFWLVWRWSCRYKETPLLGRESTPPLRQPCMRLTETGGSHLCCWLPDLCVASRGRDERHTSILSHLTLAATTVSSPSLSLFRHHSLALVHVKVCCLSFLQRIRRRRLSGAANSGYGYFEPYNRHSRFRTADTPLIGPVRATASIDTITQDGEPLLLLLEYVGGWPEEQYHAGSFLCCVYDFAPRPA